MNDNETTRNTPQETPINAEGWVITKNDDGVTLGIGMRGCWPECNVYDDPRGRRAAALISAAPELLRALEKAEKLLRNIGNEDGAHKGYNAQFIPGVRNAIIEAIPKRKESNHERPTI